MSEREAAAAVGGRNQADTTSITSSIAGQGSITGGGSVGPMGGPSAMFAKPPLPSPNSQQYLPNSKSTPALHHVGNICEYYWSHQLRGHNYSNQYVNLFQSPLQL